MTRLPGMSVRFVAFFSLSLSVPVVAQEISPSTYEKLHFRHIGPVGNRMISVVGIAGDEKTYIAGAASGGIWKTTDAGLTWKPVFDKEPVHSVGALAVAPSDPSILWAGTGETFIRSNVSIGNGVWKSTDGGESWKHMGLEGTGRIGRMIVHPQEPDIVYAAALGHAYAPQQERGVYRTKDGGKSWERVLFVDEKTGASDLVMDPSNPRRLFAGMWQLELKTWTRESGGPGSGIFVTRDGGDSWSRLEGNGLPKLPVGKIALCMTPRDPNRLYALIETGDGVPWNGKDTESGELWRSDNGGERFTLVSHDRNLAGRSAYYSRCAVATDDPDELYFLSASYYRSLDGGKTAQSAEDRDVGFTSPGWDHHDIWVDPTNADRMAVAHDGGVSISENRGKSWLKVQLPVAQMYHVTVDNQVPYYVYGNRQDGPSFRGPSRSRLGGGFDGSGISRGMWHSVGGGESGFATPDPLDPDVIWSSASGAGARGGIVVRYRESTRQFRQVEVWPESTGGWPAADLKYRFQWTFPVLVSPHDHETVFVTSQHVHRTTNGGESWEVVSPDLTTNDKSKQGISGGLTPDNIGVEYCCVIYAFDESPVEKGVYWAGSNDGLLHVSRDAGVTWTNVTKNLPGLPPLGTVRNIHASKWKAGKAYVSIDFHEVGSFEPFAYKTEDFGRTWVPITNGIEGYPLSYVRNIREDPVRQGLLYLGTENALYVSFDDGVRWQSLQNNLPSTPMYWIEVQEHFNDLVLGTYGRGFWILDDLTPLQELTSDVARSEAHLFSLRDTYRFRPITAPMEMFDDPSAGEDPPEGAPISYWLSKAPDGDVKIRIENAKGEVVRTLEGTKTEGVNRVYWDLRGEPSTQIKLRTKPLYADWVEMGEEGFRAAAIGRISILEPPGAYAVVLEVAGKEQRRNLRVLKDPHSEGTEEDIRLQTEMLTELREDLTAAAESINRIEWMRKQLQDLRALVKDLGPKDSESVLEGSQELEGTLVALEEKLYELKVVDRGQDRVRWPTMLAGRIAYLANAVAVSDFRPASQHREVQKLLKERLTTYQRELDLLLQNEIPAFNRTLEERKLPTVLTGGQE
jgi:photosystem II stability/assembly factor-like uncharacterized protein